MHSTRDSDSGGTETITQGSRNPRGQGPGRVQHSEKVAKEGLPDRTEQLTRGWATVPTAAAPVAALALFIVFSEILLVLSNTNTSVLLHWIGTRHFPKLSPSLFMEERRGVLLESHDKGQ